MSIMKQNKTSNPGSDVNRRVAKDLISYTRALIQDLHKAGKRQMARRYSITLNSFILYHGDTEVSWEQFTDTLVTGYEEFLIRRGLCRNSTSYYMRTLRSIVNRANSGQRLLNGNPFRYVYTGIDKTQKRAVSLRTVCRIRDLDLSGYPHLSFARDIFLFSFYTRGMSFVDIAYLRKTDESNGFITYTRHKTRRSISIRIEPELRTLVQRFEQNDTGYMLPVITSEGPESYTQYQTAYHRVNRNLQKVGDMLGLGVKLTMYVARHTWASIAYQNDVPLSVICKAMGHDSENTTRIYLSSLDTSRIDEANRSIISLMTHIG